MLQRQHQGAQANERLVGRDVLGRQNHGVNTSHAWNIYLSTERPADLIKKFSLLTPVSKSTMPRNKLSPFSPSPTSLLYSVTKPARSRSGNLGSSFAISAIN